jgi:hypothetical protein
MKKMHYRAGPLMNNSWSEMQSHFVVEVDAVDLASICKLAVTVIEIIALFTASNYLDSH